MTDDKYTAMMRENESWWEQQAGYYALSGSKSLAEKCVAVAADLRAMREAWEAMATALLASQLYGSQGVTSDGASVDILLRAALQKARAK